MTLGIYEASVVGHLHKVGIELCSHRSHQFPLSSVMNDISTSTMGNYLPRV